MNHDEQLLEDDAHDGAQRRPSAVSREEHLPSVAPSAASNTALNAAPERESECVSAREPREAVVLGPVSADASDDQRYMRAALEQAHAAAQAGEVPIGAVVVRDGRIIAAARNTREESHDPAGHAEFTAIRQAAHHLGAWRLTGCTVYVTLEPCVMCAGLMHQARIDRCVFGAFDPKAGALGTLYAINADERLNHVFPARGGVLEDECARLLKDFFAQRRKKRKAARKAAAIESARIQED